MPMSEKNRKRWDILKSAIQKQKVKFQDQLPNLGYVVYENTDQNKGKFTIILIGKRLEFFSGLSSK